MDKESLYQWKQHPVTQEFLIFLAKERDNCREEALDSLNLAAPDTAATACRLAYHKGKVEMIEEILNLKGEGDE